MTRVLGNGPAPHGPDGAADGSGMAAGKAPPGVFVVSDLRLYRDFLALALAQEETVELVGAASVAAAPTHVVALRPDIVLLDAGAADARCLPRSLKAYLPSLRVIACAVSGSAKDRLAWIDAGAADCVHEEGGIAEVVRTIHRVWRNEIVCPPELLMLLPRRAGVPAGNGPAAALPIGGLTERERQVLSLVVAGLSNQEIARELGLLPATVKNHVHRVLHKLGVPDWREAARQPRR